MEKLKIIGIMALILIGLCIVWVFDRDGFNQIEEEG